MSRADLHPDLQAALTGRRDDLRVVLRWEGVDGTLCTGITDTLSSLTLLVTGAVQTVIGGRPVVVGLTPAPVPLFRGPDTATGYLLRRAVDPGEGGRACRRALRYLATRDTTAERVGATYVGETIALF